MNRRLTTILVAGALAAAAAVPRGAAAGPCSGYGVLSGLGCALYVIVLIPSLAIPELSMPVDVTESEVLPGLLWEVPFAIQDEDWLHHPFASIAYYTGPSEVVGRVGYRLRLPLDLDLFYLYAGAGGFYGTAGGGPRAELRLSIGAAAGAGVYFSGAYEPTFGDVFRHRVEVSAGFEAPIVL